MKKALQEGLTLYLTWETKRFILIFKEGGEVHEMDVSSCYSLFDLWIVAMVLAMDILFSMVRTVLRGQRFRQLELFFSSSGPDRDL